MCHGAQMAIFLRIFFSPVLSASRVQQLSDLRLKFALRPHHVWQYGRHPIYCCWEKEAICVITALQLYTISQKKTVHISFCQNFVKFPIIFSTKKLLSVCAGYRPGESLWVHSDGVNVKPTFHRRSDLSLLNKDLYSFRRNRGRKSEIVLALPLPLLRGSRPKFVRDSSKQ